LLAAIAIADSAAAASNRPTMARTLDVDGGDAADSDGDLDPWRLVGDGLSRGKGALSASDCLGLPSPETCPLFESLDASCFCFQSQISSLLGFEGLSTITGLAGE
jgi:hypothetical protein